MFREAPIPPQRVNVPLLRANTPYLHYRKGPFAIYALQEYIGKENVARALRRLHQKVDAGVPGATTLDLYEELQMDAPDSLSYLLHDLFEANTSWVFETEQVVAQPTDSGQWQVTLDVRARKMVIDTTGVETELPMDDWVEIGVFVPAEGVDWPGEPLYLQMHRIQSGRQTIKITVSRQPEFAGIDPYDLLDWGDFDIKEIE